MPHDKATVMRVCVFVHALLCTLVWKYFGQADLLALFENQMAVAPRAGSGLMRVAYGFSFPRAPVLLSRGLALPGSLSGVAPYFKLTVFRMPA